MKSYNRIAYGMAPLKIKKGPGSSLIQGVSKVGVRVVQYVYLRPPKYGYSIGRKS